MNPRQDFLGRLARGPLVLDGAMGTELMRAGIAGGEASEAWLLSRPQAIAAVHAAYDAAGSEVLYTNTFGANRISLARHGLADRTAELNRLAVTLARGVATKARWIAGSMGPTGALLEPYGDLEEAAAAEAFAEQAAALVAGGADLLVVESHADVNEAALAVRAARAAGPVAVLATMTFQDEAHGFRTLMGVTPEQAATALLDAGADAVGANCGEGPAVARAVIRRMRAAAPAAPLISKPNAGPFATDHAGFTEAQRGIRDDGAALLGGCCGTGPAHLALLAAAITPPR